ncbi:serine hydrolase domain-containing protein [Kitasatospora sp. CM 4170]|uniref:Serine hydrolase domain-containing protein n=1 Tax=Kitasatospora aburaviensis TaxID=67265 RepID=A0ABW1F2X9_9ACTN|nr:serine hydrolase domain-containing protein [Kitasatospora sp. CM 4170]WNM45507.1 serine hydrolase domain-containing protein [Kitasatospora sp. CM 4170]
MSGHRLGVLRATEPGVSVLLRRPGEDAIQLHFGLANLEHAVPIDANTAFNVGSVAKQITAHLVLLAAQNGMLALDQQANQLLPELQVHDLTISDLITHRSGLRDAESLVSLAGLRDLDHYTADDLVSLACWQRQRAVPEGQFLYSNTNYLLLAKLLETVHGMDLASLARRRLFDRLGMDATHFKSDPRQLIPCAASAYHLTSGGWQHSAEPVSLPGPGSLWTTPADLDRWLGHLHDRWQRADLELPDQNVVPYQAADHAPYLYGAGLYGGFRSAQRIVFHLGHEQGFSAAVHMVDTGTRVICLSNNHAIGDRIAATLITRVLQNPTANLERSLAQALRTGSARPNESNRDRCKETLTGPDCGTDLGSFACPDVPGVLRLSRSNTVLRLWRRGASDSLVPSGSRSYTGPGYRLTLQLRPGDDAIPAGFILDLDRAPRLHYKRQSG